jgi:DNA-binding PadR family transcriptional regulator
MTNAELAILTMIAEKPRHGYEIEQVIEERGMRAWTEVGFSSIYYLLKKLEKEALIEGRMERQPGRGPARVVYKLTSTGKQAVQAGVLQALSAPKRSYPPILLGMANLPGISKGQALTALQTYREGLSSRREQVQTSRESQRPLPFFVEAMFSYSLTMIEAERAWVEEFIQQLETEDVESGF